MKKIRTRFAPSPTGYMHVGNLRTALYAYLIAKHENGDFILRIEDTDQERYVEGAIEIIYSALNMAGLQHDEGPDIGGPTGPYVQSERKNIYKEYAKMLIEKGQAYYCFCPEERLEALRKQAEALKTPYKYDKLCLGLSKEEVENKIKEGIPYVIRQNNPKTGTTTFHDEIYGSISVDNSDLDDMVLLKSDGMPTYNFANVVDDHLMGITHVVRGSEYLSSSPKYNRLYDAFEWDVPVYVHCPPIMRDAHNKLSKRKGDASYEDLLEKGFLKEAVLNYIALLGWNPGTEQEIFSLEELIQEFDYRKINKAPAIFDMEKLKWMNGEYIRRLPLDVFHNMALPYYKQVLKKEYDLKKISELLHTRTEILTAIPSQLDFLDELPEYPIDMYVHKKMKTNYEVSINSLVKALPILKSLDSWNIDSIKDSISKLIKEMEIKNATMLWPIRTAISGKSFTPGGAYELAEILGQDETVRRIGIGIEKLKTEQ